MFSTVRKHELLFASRCTLVLKVKTETLEELKKKKKLKTWTDCLTRLPVNSLSCKKHFFVLNVWFLILRAVCI